MNDDSHSKPPESLDYAGPGAFAKRDAAAADQRIVAFAWIAIVGGIFFLTAAFFIFRHQGGGNVVTTDANLHQIGQAIRLYTNDFHGQYPDTITALLMTQDLSSSVFVSPHSGDDAATGPTTQAVAENLTTPGHCSYIYLGKGLTTQTATPTTVIAYEPPSLNSGKGGYVLFADGSVGFFNMPVMNSIMNQVNAKVWPVCYPPMPAARP